MRIHDDIYHWEGWGGKLQLGSGKCRLRIYDLTHCGQEALTHLRPILVMISDIPGGTMTIRSCVSHIATGVVRDFGLDKNRMLWIEYYPGKAYGANNVNRIPERFEAVEFTWHGNDAIKPKWRELQPPMRDSLKGFLDNP